MTSVRNRELYITSVRNRKDNYCKELDIRFLLLYREINLDFRDLLLLDNEYT